jgi:hypothetical protein
VIADISRQAMTDSSIGPELLLSHITSYQMRSETDIKAISSLRVAKELEIT